jgi:hypothetical protein
MYNTDLPSRAELPSSTQLLRSTLLALVSAAGLLVTVVLPAEYGLDPTGVGQVLGLQEMGAIKQQLAAEAQAERASTSASASETIAESLADSSSAAVEVPASSWRDELSLTLTPGQGAEIKLVMQESAEAEFEWTTTGGPVNFDLHGDGDGQSISYQQGRFYPSDEGKLKATFTGDHGWFFRNRNQTTVTVVLRVRGDYQEAKRVL